MIEGKTAALIAAACEIGAILAGADNARAQTLAEFGRQLGLAFQIQDDLLGIWGDPDLTGKHSSDLTHRKKTLPTLYAAERDEALRRRYFARAAAPDAAEVEWLRQAIERNNGRDYTERAARAAHKRALAALRALPDCPPRHLLHALTQSLIGRNA